MTDEQGKTKSEELAKRLLFNIAKCVELKILRNFVNQGSGSVWVRFGRDTNSEFLQHIFLKN